MNPKPLPISPQDRSPKKEFFSILATIVFTLVSLPALAAEPRLGSYVESGTVNEIVGDDWVGGFAGLLSLDTEIEWSVTVPETYTPESPAGVVVYISPSNSGKMPRRWKSLMDDKNLIWVAANGSGNKVDPRLRVAYSLLAPVFIDSKYEIDLSRIYVTGLSGGGRVASIVAPKYASFFRGGIYICGVNRPPKDLLSQLAESDTNRFVFLTGVNDFNRDETKKFYTMYRRAGVENSLYLELRNMGHENPNARGFARALAYLDGEES